jgi:hypothetical protein
MKTIINIVPFDASLPVVAFPPETESYPLITKYLMVLYDEEKKENTELIIDEKVFERTNPEPDKEWKG